VKMLSNLDPSSQQFLDNLNKISDRMTQAQQRISTGLKIRQVSDEPDSISVLLGARASLSSTEQILTNLGRVQMETNAAEQALQSAVQLFDKVRTLGAQGNTDVQSAAGRAALADEIDGILQQFVGLAGTAVEGRYILAGDTDQQVPYTYTAGQPNPVSAYLGSASTRLVQHPNGTTFSVSRTAQEIFDSTDPAKNVFFAIQTLSSALRANDRAAVATAFDGLAHVSEHLNAELAFYGTTQNKVAAAVDFGQTQRTQLHTQIANLEEADLTQAILDLTQSQTQQQAALQSRAMVPRRTLFDYLG
jgi:flagellin-like hook-associated protein FlgL